MPSEYRMRRRVEFVETDMAGIVHFSNYFRWMEQAEHAFFRSLGLSLHGQDDGKMTGFARVLASCEYQRPLHYGELVEARLRVVGKTAATLTYDVEFLRVEETTDAVERTARGRMKVCCVTREGRERLRATELPSDIAAALEVATPPPDPVRP